MDIAIWNSIFPSIRTIRRKLIWYLIHSWGWVDRIVVGRFWWCIHCLTGERSLDIFLLYMARVSTKTRKHSRFCKSNRGKDVSIRFRNSDNNLQELLMALVWRFCSCFRKEPQVRKLKFKWLHTSWTHFHRLIYDCFFWGLILMSR